MAKLKIPKAAQGGHELTNLLWRGEGSVQLGVWLQVPSEHDNDVVAIVNGSFSL